MSEAPKDPQEQMDNATEALTGHPSPVQPPATPVAAPTPPPIANIAAGLSPNAHKQAEKQSKEVKDDFPYDVAFNFAFLGTGQGGGRIADAFYKLGYRRVAAFNTTEQDFNDLTLETHKLSLDVGGASKEPDKAKAALKGREEDVRDLMTVAWGKNVDYAMICIGLGGGTGSGTGPELVRIAQQYMADQGRPVRVGAVVSLPPVTEGYQVARNAVQGFNELVQLNVSPLIVIDNARIDQLYKPAMSQRNAVANNTISQLFHLFNQLSAVHSPFATFDRSELAQLLDSGLITFGAANIPKIDTPADISSSIREQLTQSVLAEVELDTASKAACLFVGGQHEMDTLDMDYFDAGFTQMERMMHKESIVHRGVYLGGSPGLQAYTMLAGLDVPKQRLKQLAEKGKVTKGKSSMASHLGIDD